MKNYLVSKNGIVKNKTTGRVLKPWIDNGYLRVNVGGKKKYIHQLVAEEYLPTNRNKSYTVDHIDNNRLNNGVKNLKYSSKKKQRLNQKRMK